MQNSRRGSEDAAVRCLLCDPGGGGNHQHGDRISGVWAGLVSSQLRNFSGLTPRSHVWVAVAGSKQISRSLARDRDIFRFSILPHMYACLGVISRHLLTHFFLSGGKVRVFVEFCRSLSLLPFPSPGPVGGPDGLDVVVELLLLLTQRQRDVIEIE